MRLFFRALMFLTLVSAATAQTIATKSGTVRVMPIIDGLDVPWALDFLPDGSFLVTERKGNLLLVRDGKAQRIKGAPRVAARGQGGLLDVMVPRDFQTSRQIYLSYARDQGGGAGTAVAVGRLSADGTKLEGTRTIFEAAPGATGGRHFGSRIVESPDGTIFVTIGERGDRPSAQDRRNHNGSIVRLRRDGSVPADNPFVNMEGIRSEIWSYGHRNPQGAALDLDGNLWTAEHGARGGDEVNRIRKGANYGWPVISYGRHYSGAKIGEGTTKSGMEQPEFFWDPSIAPSGLMIYSGKLWPEWRGDFFVGSLKLDHINRLGGRPPRETERISAPQTGRVRDIAEAPDGSIWFISESSGTIFRMTPG